MLAAVFSKIRKDIDQVDSQSLVPVVEEFKIREHVRSSQPESSLSSYAQVR